MGSYVWPACLPDMRSESERREMIDEKERAEITERIRQKYFDYLSDGTGFVARNIVADVVADVEKILKRQASIHEY